MKKARKTKPAPGGKKKKATRRKTRAQRKPIMRHSKEG
jgi:hypothetical protein